MAKGSAGFRFCHCLKSSLIKKAALAAAFVGVASLLYQLDRKQSLEERTVALQGYTQVFCRDVVTAIPLVFEIGSLFREDLGEALHSRGNQSIRLLNGFARLVDEAGLDFVPTGMKSLGLISRK